MGVPYYFGSSLGLAWGISKTFDFLLSRSRKPIYAKNHLSGQGDFFPKSIFLLLFGQKNNFLVSPKQGCMNGQNNIWILLRVFFMIGPNWSKNYSKILSNDWPNRNQIWDLVLLIWAVGQKTNYSRPPQFYFTTQKDILYGSSLCPTGNRVSPFCIDNLVITAIERKASEWCKMLCRNFCFEIQYCLNLLLTVTCLLWTQVINANLSASPTIVAGHLTFNIVTPMYPSYTSPCSNGCKCDFKARQKSQHHWKFL